MYIHNKEGENMKILGIRFSDAQKLKINDVSDVVGIDSSKVARAAMRLGMEQIIALCAVDADKGKDLILINDVRSK